MKNVLYEMYSFIKNLQDKFFSIETKDKKDLVDTFVYQEVIYNLDVRTEKLRAKMYNTKADCIKKTARLVFTNLKH